MAITPPIGRLQAHLKVMPDGCWEFQGSCNLRGYGVIGKGRRGEGNVLTHRVMWEIVFGSIPKGLKVLHSCDNSPCCNPAHLFLGTHDANMADMTAKNRQSRGEDRPCSKLTWAVIPVIKEDCRTHREIASDYGVSRSLIQAVKSGKVWKEAS